MKYVLNRNLTLFIYFDTPQAPRYLMWSDYGEGGGMEREKGMTATTRIHPIHNTRFIDDFMDLGLGLGKIWLILAILNENDKVTHIRR